MFSSMVEIILTSEVSKYDVCDQKNLEKDMFFLLIFTAIRINDIYCLLNLIKISPDIKIFLYIFKLMMWS